MTDSRNFMPVHLNRRDGRYAVVVDPLTEVLDVSRVSGAVLAHVCANNPWGIRLSSTPGAAFHAITAGTCWLRLDGSAPLQLMPGDVVLLPTGSTHDMVSSPDSRARAFDRVAKEELMTPDGDLVIAGPGAVTRFICAAYDYDHEVAHPLLSLLPPVVHIPASAPGDGGPIQSTLRLLAGELGGRSPGSRSVVTRLTDVLFVQVLREWLAREGGGACWLRALRDPQIAEVIAVMHARPAEPWTLATLAQSVNLSRATLARRFTELVGEPPLTYLTRWRMDLAARRLRETTEPVNVIAHGVGYTSEFAFSRAFTRMRREAPGRYRRASTKALHASPAVAISRPRA
jgi:AraC-like DNA-binding protein